MTPTRRSFFASLAALVVAPKVLKAPRELRYWPIPAPGIAPQAWAYVDDPIEIPQRWHDEIVRTVARNSPFVALPMKWRT